MIPVLQQRYFNTSAFAIRLNDSQRFRVYRIGNQYLVFVSFQSHEDRFSSRNCTIVDARIGNIQTGQFTDLRLILEYGLQDALRDLGLIWGISRYEFFLGSNRFDDRRNMVGIDTRSAEDRSEHDVLFGNLLHLLQNFQFRFSFRNIQIFQFYLFRNHGIKVIDRCITDVIQHGFLFTYCFRNISAHDQASFAQTSSYAAASSSSSVPVTSLTLISHAP